MVSTDGTRFSQVELSGASAESLAILIPRTAIEPLMALTGAGGANEIAVAVDDTRICLSRGARQLSARGVTGNFPNYEAVLPTGQGRELTVDRQPFGFHPVLEIFEARATQYAVVARLTQAFKRLLPALRYESVNRQWEMAEFEYRPRGWPQARRFVVVRRFIPDEEPQSTLFTLGHYVYRAWVTNMDLTPSGVWHYHDGHAGMEPRICELREDYALRKISTASFAANALYLEIVRLAYNLVTAFQRNCLEESWQSFTLQKLRYKLFLLLGELTRPQQNRLVLRLRESPLLQDLANGILRKVHRLKSIQV